MLSNKQTKIQTNKRSLKIFVQVNSLIKIQKVIRWGGVRAYPSAEYSKPPPQQGEKSPLVTFRGSSVLILMYVFKNPFAGAGGDTRSIFNRFELRVFPSLRLVA